MMKSFSQREPLWAYEKIKGSELTIGRFGCLITCIADLSTYFQDNLTPLDINAICKFTNSGLLYWDSAVFGHFKFRKRERFRNDKGITDALKDPLSAVLLEVANGSHWVVGVEHYANNGVYKIADPWLGDWSSTKRYADNITGSAYFSRI